MTTAPVLTEMFAVKPYLRHEALVTCKTADLLKDLKSHQVVASNEILEGQMPLPVVTVVTEDQSDFLVNGLH